MSAPYVELHAHSAFSFLDGASTPAELAGRGRALGYPRLGAHRPRRHLGVDGVRPRLQGPRRAPDHRRRADSLPGGAHLTLLVERQAGYRNLCRLLTAAHAHTRDEAAAQRRPALGERWSRSSEHAEGLICLSGCARDGALAGRLGARRVLRRRRRSGGACSTPSGRALPGRAAASLLAPRPRPQPLARGARRAPRGALRRDRERPLPRRARAPACRMPSSRSDCGLDAGGVRAAAPRQRAPRRSPRRGEMAQRFAEHPEAVAETVRLAERLRFDLTDELGYRYPGSEDPSADRKLAEICRALLAERYAGSAPRAEAEAARARGGAGDDPRPRPLRLLPPSPRPARVGPRGRGARCAAPTRRARSCRRAAAAARASARSSAT